MKQKVLLTLEDKREIAQKWKLIHLDEKTWFFVDEDNKWYRFNLKAFKEQHGT